MRPVLVTLAAVLVDEQPERKWLPSARWREAPVHVPLARSLTSEHPERTREQRLLVADASIAATLARRRRGDTRRRARLVPPRTSDTRRAGSVPQVLVRDASQFASLPPRRACHVALGARLAFRLVVDGPGEVRHAAVAVVLEAARASFPRVVAGLQTRGVRLAPKEVSLARRDVSLARKDLSLARSIRSPGARSRKLTPWRADKARHGASLGRVTPCRKEARRRLPPSSPSVSSGLIFHPPSRESRAAVRQRLAHPRRRHRPRDGPRPRVAWKEARRSRCAPTGERCSKALDRSLTTGLEDLSALAVLEANRWATRARLCGTTGS